MCQHQGDAILRGEPAQPAVCEGTFTETGDLVPADVFVDHEERVGVPAVGLQHGRGGVIGGHYEDVGFQREDVRNDPVYLFNYGHLFLKVPVFSVPSG